MELELAATGSCLPHNKPHWICAVFSVSAALLASHRPITSVMSRQVWDDIWSATGPQNEIPFHTRLRPKWVKNSYICPQNTGHVLWPHHARAPLCILHSHVVLQWQSWCRLIKVRQLNKISRHGYLAWLILSYTDFHISYAHWQVLGQKKHWQGMCLNWNHAMVI